MRIAAIDIGTNTILMLIAEMNSAGQLNVLADEQLIARLGKGVDAHKMILPETFVRCNDFLLQYKYKAETFGIDKIVATGTSALRDAHNRVDFIDSMFQTTGIQIEIISRDDEAVWTYRGAISGFNNLKQRCAVLDIGGGSTELIIGNQMQIESMRSVDIGSVRVTEKFLHHSPPLDKELQRADKFINEQIILYPQFNIHDTSFIGVAGTVTTLAALELGLKIFDGKKVSGVVLQKDRIDFYYNRFRDMTADQIRSHVQIDPGRADIIFAGVMILKKIMEMQGMNKILVSERGLRFGIAIRELEKINHQKD